MDAECLDVQELLQRRLDGESLDAGEQEAIAGHLATCAGCRAFERDMQQLAGVIARLPLQAAPPALVPHIMSSLRQSSAAAPARRASVAWLWPALAALVGVAVLAYNAAAAHGVSLFDVPGALLEWAALVDVTNLATVFDATGIFAGSIGAEVLVGVSLLAIAALATMATVMGRPPDLQAPSARSVGWVSRPPAG